MGSRPSRLRRSRGQYFRARTRQNSRCSATHSPLIHTPVRSIAGERDQAGPLPHPIPPRPPSPSASRLSTPPNAPDRTTRLPTPDSSRTGGARPTRTRPDQFRDTAPSGTAAHCHHMWPPKETDEGDRSGTVWLPDVLKLLDTDRPEIGPDDVLVRVHAAALNP